MTLLKTSSDVKSASFSASIIVASLCARHASSSSLSSGSAPPSIREARSSGRWTRYSALPAPSDEYIDSSATNAGRRCRVSPQRLPVQGSRPDPLSHFLCRLSKASDQSCRPRGLACMSPSPSLSPLWLSLPSAKTQRMACLAHSPARGPPWRARGAAGLSTKAAAPPARLTR